MCSLEIIWQYLWCHRRGLRNTGGPGKKEECMNYDYAELFFFLSHLRIYLEKRWLLASATWVKLQALLKCLLIFIETILSIFFFRFHRGLKEKKKCGYGDSWLNLSAQSKNQHGEVSVIGYDRIQKSLTMCACQTKKSEMPQLEKKLLF